MDLISISRRYKNVKKILILILLLIIIIYVSLIINKYSENKRREKIYQSYEKVYERLNVDNIAQVEKEKWVADVENVYKTEEKRVFLTFDDGPSKKVTLPILDLLQQENIKATFFVLGSRAELNPDIVKREYEEGHYIANHGYSHTYSKIYSSVDAVLEEYYKTEETIKNAIGDSEYTSLLFRFPGGSTGGKYKQIKQEAKERLKENSIAYVDWNVLTGDAEGGKKSVEQLVSRLYETIGNKNSIVILMHDAGDKTTTYEALPQIIQSLRDNGYEFRNFYDLIK